MTEKDIWHGDHADLNLVTDKNRRDKNGDMKGKPLRYEVRSRIMNLLEQKVEGKNGKMRNMNHDEIAKMMGVCKKTISNYKRATKNQNLEKIHDPEMGILTVGVPAPGKQGGFRWARMNEEQQEMCVQLATEYPRDTVAQLKQKLQEKYPELNVSDSTVWRTLKTANISFVRAKMKDPLGEGDLASKAKQDELKDFILEQDKEDGMLNPLNLFFMDETLVTLNEVSRRGWGSKDSIPEFAKSKGKTLTLNLYVGLGLVSNSYTSSNDDEFRESVLEPGCTITDLTPRGNHLFYDEQTQCWTRAKDPPKFALFWWIRPPTREGTALSRFLNVDDILDPNFRLFNPEKIKKDDLGNECKGPELNKWLKWDNKSSWTKKGKILVRKKKAFQEMLEKKIKTNNNKNRIELSPDEIDLFKITRRSYIKLDNDDKDIYYPEAANDNKPTDEVELECGFFKPALTMERTIFGMKAKSLSINSSDLSLEITYEDDSVQSIKLMNENEYQGDSIPLDITNFEWTSKMAEYSIETYFKIENEGTKYYFLNSVQLNSKHKEYLDEFLNYQIDKESVPTMQKLLWLNGIEYRQVDKEDGSLIKVNVSDSKNKKQNTAFVNSSLQDMIYYFKELQVLVKNALGIDRSVPVSKIIPRSYYTPTGRNTLGGKVDSERGDRALFLKYLVETVNYYTSAFPSDVLDNLRLAWDSAPQHGKIDVDSNHYSYIHNWCKNFLDVDAIFLPVKAPDYNPAENLIGYIKGQIRLKQRSFTGEATIAKMVELIDSAMNKVTESMVKGWVRYGCYKIPGDDTPLDQKRCVDKVLEHKPSANYLDIALNIWKQDLFSKYSGLKDEDIFENGEFKPEVLETIKYSYDYTKLKKMLRKYKFVQDIKDDIAIGKITNLTPKQQELELDANDTIILSGNVFNFTVDSKFIQKIKVDEKTGVINITRKDGNKIKYFVTFQEGPRGDVILQSDGNNGYTFTNNIIFNEDTVIEYNNKKFLNKCSIHIDNFKIPEYRELLNLTAQCKEDSNFPCIAKFLKAKLMEEDEKAGDFGKEYTLKLIQFLDYISEYISESRGPMYYLKNCQKIVDKVVDKIHNGDTLEMSIEDKLDVLLNGFLPYFKIGDIVNIIAEENGGSKIKHNGLDTSYYTDEKLPSQEEIVTKVRDKYIEVGKSKFASKKSSKFQMMKFQNEGIDFEEATMKKLIEKTPYVSSIPSEKESEEIYTIGMSVVVLKAILHERDIIGEINNNLGHAIEEEIDDTNLINWSKILKTCNESVLKLKRKCEKCEKSKFKRFPVFDIFSLREKHLTQMKMQQKALYKKNKDERRWPGYPKLSQDELDEKYEERGTGPDFNVVVEDGKRRLNNILENVVVNDNNENSVTIMDNGVEKIVNKEDEKEWNYYFGPFSKENQLKLQLAIQRMRENQAKITKMENVKKNELQISKGKTIDVVMPDGTTIVLKKPNQNKEVFYDYKSKRVYPPVDMSYTQMTSSTSNEKYQLILIPDLDTFDGLENLKETLPECMIHSDFEYNSTKFGFKTNTYAPFPRKKLGITLNFKNLSRNKDIPSQMYYVTKEDYEKFFGEIEQPASLEIYEFTKHPTLQLQIHNRIPILQNKTTKDKYVLIQKARFDEQHRQMTLKVPTDNENKNKDLMKKGFELSDKEDIIIHKMIEDIEINTRI